MSRTLRIALVALAAVALLEWWSSHRPVVPEIAGPPARPTHASTVDGRSSLPPEAIETLQAIDRGGPFPYARDGVVFENREHRLPGKPRGYYHEYTVVTPGSSDRGARRIIAGGDPPEVYYYTDDHYRSFRRVEMSR